MNAIWSGCVEASTTCASLRQISTLRAQRSESVCKRRERHRVYKEEQDLSGVSRTDSPLGGARIVGAGESGKQAVWYTVGLDT
jgi:hypothetical protein